MKWEIRAPRTYTVFGILICLLVLTLVFVLQGVRISLREDASPILEAAVTSGSRLAVTPPTVLKSLIEPQTVSAPRPFSPDAAYPDLDSFQHAIGGPGVFLRSEHVGVMAPRTRSAEAGLVFGYLVEGYDALHRMTGVHTEHAVLFYFFPEGHPAYTGGWNGTVVNFDETNLDPSKQDSWRQYGVPSMRGCYHAMAGSFVEASGMRFGGTAISWSLAQHATLAVAYNPEAERQVKADRATLGDTYVRYRNAENVFPEDLDDGLAYRVYAHVLREAELAYGEDFWSDVFSAIRKHRPSVDADANVRHALTVEALSKLEGAKFGARLSEAGISATVDMQRRMDRGGVWDRRFN